MWTLHISFIKAIRVVDDFFLGHVLGVRIISWTVGLFQRFIHIIYLYRAEPGRNGQKFWNVRRDTSSSQCTLIIIKFNVHSESNSSESNLTAWNEETLVFSAQWIRYWLLQLSHTRVHWLAAHKLTFRRNAVTLFEVARRSQNWPWWIRMPGSKGIQSVAPNAPQTTNTPIGKHKQLHLHLPPLWPNKQISKRGSTPPEVQYPTKSSDTRQ